MKFRSFLLALAAGVSLMGTAQAASIQQFCMPGSTSVPGNCQAFPSDQTQIIGPLNALIGNLNANVTSATVGSPCACQQGADNARPPKG